MSKTKNDRNIYLKSLALLYSSGYDGSMRGIKHDNDAAYIYLKSCCFTSAVNLELDGKSANIQNERILNYINAINGNVDKLVNGIVSVDGGLSEKFKNKSVQILVRTISKGINQSNVLSHFHEYKGFTMKPIFTLLIDSLVLFIFLFLCNSMFFQKL